jgi:hypothetical protein
MPQELCSANAGAQHYPEFVSINPSRRKGQPEGKYRAFLWFIAGRYPPMMIFYDAFANGESQARSVSFAVRGKRFEQLASNFRGNPGPSILDFGYNLFFVGPHTQKDFSPVRHGIRRIVNKIFENPPQPFWV